MAAPPSFSELFRAASDQSELAARHSSQAIKCWQSYMASRFLSTVPAPAPTIPGLRPIWHRCY